MLLVLMLVIGGRVEVALTNVRFGPYANWAKGGRVYIHMKRLGCTSQRAHKGLVAHGGGTDRLGQCSAYVQGQS